MVYIDNTKNYFAKVERGIGINKESKLEGIKVNNLIGTYLLGPILVLNPLLTKKILLAALLTVPFCITGCSKGGSEAEKIITVSVFDRGNVPASEGTYENNRWTKFINENSGVNVKWVPIPRNEAKPGDLIFFQGTYDTAGASHVGIYVGNGMMIHCGNPISYASIETSYWQQHFYCFGRIRN